MILIKFLFVLYFETTKNQFCQSNLEEQRKSFEGNAKSKGRAHVLLGERRWKNLDMFLLKKGNL